MVRAIAGRLVMLVTIAGGIGCDAKPPGQPSPLPDPGPGTLSVTSFESVGWHLNGEFHYRPSLRVTAGRDGSAVDVSAVSFEGSGEAGSSGPTGVRYPNGRRVSPGGTLDLSSGFPAVEIVTGFRLDRLRVTVEFVDVAGRAGSTSAEWAVPALSTDAPDAALAIGSFLVAGSFSEGRFSYWPKLTLLETTGHSQVTIVKMTFELLDVGPFGGASIPELIVVPPGGTIVLDEDPLGFGGPWRTIDSSVRAARVSVVIHFMDAAGRGGSVTAIAEVS